MPAGGTAVREGDHEVPLTRLQRQVGRYVHGALDGPITVTERGKPIAVLIDFDEYRSLVDLEEQAEDLYWTVVALRRQIEWEKRSDKSLIPLAEVEQRANDRD